MKKFAIALLLVIAIFIAPMTISETAFVFVNVEPDKLITVEPTQTPEPPVVLNNQEGIADSTAEPDPLYGKTNAKDVNTRQSASTKSKQMGKIAKKGTEVEIIGGETDNSGEEWLRILWDKKEVYILGKFIDIVYAADASVESKTHYAASGDALTFTSSGSANSGGSSNSSGSQRNLSGQDAPKQTQRPTERPTERPTQKPTEKPTQSPTQRPTPYPTQAPQSNTGGQVWIPTNGGKKYHRSSTCSNMIDPRQVSLSEAQRLGFTACSKCY